MERFRFDRNQIEQIYDEIMRRLNKEIADDYAVVGRARLRAAYKDTVLSMLQGVYGTLMVISSNWPDVAQWAREIEEERHLYEDI